MPAFGGDTMSPRWPLPMGATRSMIRVLIWFGSVSSRNRSCGYSGVSLPNSARLRASSEVAPLISSMRTRALNFCRCCSPSRWALTAPRTASPLRRPFFFTWPRET